MLAAPALIAALLVAATGVDDAPWQTQLTFHGATASAVTQANGYALTAGDGTTHTIARQPASATTASPLIDALFALAQSELAAARVAHITDGAFNDGHPLPCACLQTGAKWTYVWTRDLAYATDLALFRFDAQRARNGLEFKLSAARVASRPPAGSESAIPGEGRALYVVQDTGSGGSWPVSTDRIVWFLGARHLLGDPGFSEKVYIALQATLAQDRRYAFDVDAGLYRGETSFLDWREQSYPRWTANDVTFIAESFALSTNVLHAEALRLAARLAGEHADVRAAAQYRLQADALARAVDRRFWREDRGLYMSYIGGAGAPRAIEAYDLLGTSLAILAGVAPPARARRALANYPSWEAGSPVIWPERADVPIYHNRAIWPFVSAYALKAARALDAPARIAHELRSILRGAALAGSNMENYELTTQAVHVDDGERSGPVVNSKRQLWSVAAMLDAVVEGIFGLTDHDLIEPKIPRDLLPMLFADRDEIRLDLPGRSITLVKPARLSPRDNLLVAGAIGGSASDRRVMLRGVHVEDKPLPFGHPQFAPATPAQPRVESDGKALVVDAGASGSPLRLYVDGIFRRTFSGHMMLAVTGRQQCLSVTTVDRDGIESLPSEPRCVGPVEAVGGEWPRSWMASDSGRFRARIDFNNAHGPINTGITAAVKMLQVSCGRQPLQRAPIVMPHSEGEQSSTSVVFNAAAGERCRFALDEGFNMSFLEHYAGYTGGAGGARGPLNDAGYGDLQIAPL